jgi:WD40 repeat protein
VSSLYVIFSIYTFCIFKDLKLKCSRCICTLKGHSDAVKAIKLVSDTYLASCSFDKTIKLWNLDSFMCVNTLKGHDDNITALELTKDGRLVSASHDGWIKLWSLWSDNDDRLEAECESSFHNSYPINSIKILSNDLLAIGDASILQNVKILNLTNKLYFKKFHAHNSMINDLSLLEQSSKLVSCSESIRIWSV